VSFSEFSTLCEKVRLTSSKNAKVAIIAEYLAKLDDLSLPAAVLFLSGAVFPKGSGLALNVGFNTIMQSLSEIARLEPASAPCRKSNGARLCRSGNSSCPTCTTS
jgi:DNA ligase 1